MKVFFGVALAITIVLALAFSAEARPGGPGMASITSGEKYINISNPRGDISISIVSENGTKTIEIEKDFEDVQSIKTITIKPGHAEVEMETETENGTVSRNMSANVSTIRTRMKERIRNMTCEEQCPFLNISYNNSLKKAIIISSNWSVISNNTIEVENGSVYILAKKNVRKELKVLPETASETARTRVNYHLIKAVEIEDSNGNVYYAIKGVQAGKILGLFGTQMDVQTDVDIESGDVRQVHRPWWSFLVF